MSRCFRFAALFCCASGKRVLSMEISIVALCQLAYQIKLNQPHDSHDDGIFFALWLLCATSMLLLWCSLTASFVSLTYYPYGSVYMCLYAYTNLYPRFVQFSGSR